MLTGPTVDRRWRSVARQVPRWLLELKREQLSLLPILLGDYLRFGPVSMLDTARFALADAPEDKMPRVVAPTLVVRGERDAFVFDAWLRRCAELLPAGDIATIAGAAHAVNFSARPTGSWSTRSRTPESCSARDRLRGGSPRARGRREDRHR